MASSQHVLTNPDKTGLSVKCQKCGKSFKPLNAGTKICLPCMFPGNAINPVQKAEKKPDKKVKPEKYFLKPGQLNAIKDAYLPLLPLPPVSCHKTISLQLKIDEFKVFKAIGIIRKQMKLPRFIEREGYEYKAGQGHYEKTALSTDVITN